MKYSLAETIEGYVTSQDPSNTDPRLLVGGSKNVQIDQQKKVKSRSGYTRLGAANTALTEVRNAWTWATSTGHKRPMRFYDDELEVYLESVDGTDINAWTRVSSGWSTTELLRSCIQKGGNGGWYDATEKIDLCLMVQADANIYEWNGAVAVVSSVVAGTTTVYTASTISFTSPFTILDSANGFVAAGFVVGDVVTVTGTTDNNFTWQIATLAAGTITLTPNGRAVVPEGAGSSFTITAQGQSITKTGTTTFAQNRFYTTRNKTVVNVRTGTEYTYTGGAGTTTIYNITSVTGLIAGDILVQKVVTYSDKPTASRTNHFIHNFENQVIIGSEDDNLVYGSKNNDLDDFTFSSPRAAGEGFLLTLDNPTRALTALGSQLLIGAGKSVIFKVVFEQLAVGTDVVETAKIKRLDVGVNQGFLNQESIVPVGNTIFFLTNEVALRTIEDPDNLTGINPKTMSNPIKPDFDAEDWTSAFGMWSKNTLYYSAPRGSRLYMLNFIEDSNGKLFRFWNPPQVLPVQALTHIEIEDVEQLYGHSNGVPETYLLFDGGSDGQYASMQTEEKLPIECRAIFAYNNYKKKAELKNFDEYFVVGDITSATTAVDLILRYDFDGVTQEITKTINGSDEEILEGQVGINSLAQQSLAVNPLGGLLYPPADARRFRVDFEIAREDFFELSTEFYTNDVDKYWAILSHGANVELSKRRPINIKK